MKPLMGTQHGGSCFGPIFFLPFFMLFNLFFVLNIFLTLLLPHYKKDYSKKKFLAFVGGL